MDKSTVVITERREVPTFFGRHLVVGRSGGGAHRNLAERSPRVVLIDAQLGLAKAKCWNRQITKRWPKAKVILFGVRRIDRDWLSQAKFRVSGYLLEGSSKDDLRSVMRSALEDQVICSPEQAFGLFSRLAEMAFCVRELRRIESLTVTPREIEVLDLAAKGYSNGEIADHLFISAETVKNHVHSILQKLDVRNRTEASNYAVAQDWIHRV